MKSLITSIFIFCISNIAYSQDISDYKALEKLKFKQDTAINYSTFRNQSGTFSVIFTELFIFYKHFISSQDGNRCPFEPSCSVYFVESIRKYGLIKGYLNGFDRYMRCNGLNVKKYRKNSSGKLQDNELEIKHK